MDGVYTQQKKYMRSEYYILSDTVSPYFLNSKNVVSMKLYFIMNFILSSLASMSNSTESHDRLQIELIFFFFFYFISL